MEKDSLIDLQLQWLIITGTITDEHLRNSSFVHKLLIQIYGADFFKNLDNVSIGICNFDACSIINLLDTRLAYFREGE